MNISYENVQRLQVMKVLHQLVVHDRDTSAVLLCSFKGSDHSPCMGQLFFGRREDFIRDLYLVWMD
jgi:hypothetical protein